MQATMDQTGDGVVGDADFNQTLRHFASGVTNIAIADETGATHGMTAAAFSSLSLRPTLVLVAVARATAGPFRWALSHPRLGRLNLPPRRHGTRIAARRIISQRPS
jgi:hypothetical protein